MLGTYVWPPIVMDRPLYFTPVVSIFLLSFFLLSDDDNKILQYALDALQKWSEKWLLNLNINKCQVVTFGRSVDISCKYTIHDCNNQTISLKRGIQVLDLGVCFDEKLSFKEHIHANINKAYMMLGLIKRNFKYLTIPTFILL